MRAEVNTIAMEMERKLKANDHKRHYALLTVEELLSCADENMRSYIDSGDRGQLVDSMNYLMMAYFNDVARESAEPTPEPTGGIQRSTRSA